MNNIEELFIANAELAAELLQHMADNEIDSDYFAVVTDSPNCGREVQSEHSVTEVALMAAGIIEQLVAQLEAAQKGMNDFQRSRDRHQKVSVGLNERLIASEAALSAANEKLLKPVVLPERYSFDCGVCADPNGEWLELNDVKEAIRVAGFTVEGNADAE